jgi:transposase-like protein
MTESVLTKPRARVNWSVAEKTEWLRLFAQSGQSAAEFCRDNDLSPATLSLWRQQQTAESGTEVPALIEVPAEIVRAAAPTATPAQVTVSTPGGLRFEVPVGIDAAWLGSLLRSFADAKL